MILRQTRKRIGKARKKLNRFLAHIFWYNGNAAAKKTNIRISPSQRFSLEPSDEPAETARPAIKVVSEKPVLHKPQKTQNLLFTLHGVSKSYGYGKKGRLVVLDGINLRIVEGAITSIVGESGSGKSTLMHLIGTTDTVDSGEIYFRGTVPVHSLSPEEANVFRKYEVAFIMQEMNMITDLSVLANVMDPLMMCGVSWGLARKKALQSLDAVGIYNKRRSMVFNLSGGEKQRVAIARAMASDCSVILADEPTGSLDNVNSREVMELLRQANEKNGMSIVLITHEQRLAKMFSHYIVDLDFIKKRPFITNFHGVRADEFHIAV